MSFKNKIIALAALLLCPLFIWMYFSNSFSGESTEASAQSIKPLLKEADIPMDSYFFDDDSLVQIKRNTGTRITIKPGTFSRKDGSPIKGSVELKVREFHTASDIMLSGIPMTVNAERNEHLQSAGMIEMRAFNEGQELEIKEGRSADVALAGFRASENYDLYYLKNDSQWVTLDSFSTSKNPSREELMKNLPPLPPKPVFFDTMKNDDFIFNLAGNFEKAEYLEKLSTRKWKLCKEYSSPDIEKAMRINWDFADVKLVDKEKMIYEIMFSKQQNSYNYDSSLIFQSIRFRCTPVIDNARSREDSALFESQMTAYTQTLERIEREKREYEERLSAESKLLNCFTVEKMGIYNIDRLMKEPQLLISSVSFDFENEINVKRNRIQLYSLLLSENSVVTYEAKQWSGVGFTPGKEMMLVAVLPGNEVAVVENEDIQRALAQGRNKLYFQTKTYAIREFIENRQINLALGGKKEKPTSAQM